jgi:hypothetical protein
MTGGHREAHCHEPTNAARRSTCNRMVHDRGARARGRGRLRTPGRNRVDEVTCTACSIEVFLVGLVGIAICYSSCWSSPGYRSACVSAGGAPAGVAETRLGAGIDVHGLSANSGPDSTRRAGRSRKPLPSRRAKGLALMADAADLDVVGGGHHLAVLSHQAALGASPSRRGRRARQRGASRRTAHVHADDGRDTRATLYDVHGAVRCCIAGDVGRREVTRFRSRIRVENESGTAPVVDDSGIGVEGRRITGWSVGRRPAVSGIDL